MSNLQTYYHFKLDFQKWTNIQGVSSLRTKVKRPQAAMPLSSTNMTKVTHITVVCAVMAVHSCGENTRISWEFLSSNFIVRNLLSIVTIEVKYKWAKLVATAGKTTTLCPPHVMALWCKRFMHYWSSARENQRMYTCKIFMYTCKILM